MLFTALAHLMLQSPAPVPEIAWDAPAPAVAEVAAPRPEGASVPQWALTDPFGYERARCNPMVRGDTPLDVCQSQVRSALAAALGDDLPDALRPRGMAGDCQMVEAAAGGSDPRPAMRRPEPERGRLHRAPGDGLSSPPRARRLHLGVPTGEQPGVEGPEAAALGRRGLRHAKTPPATRRAAFESCREDQLRLSRRLSFTPPTAF